MEDEASKPGGQTPVACVVLGLAGAGKSSLVQRLASELSRTRTPGYFVNLDPAVADPLVSPNVDIRDSVKIKEVMTEYGLGPNGAILTSLNLFCTRFDQVLALVQKRAHQVEILVFDTPGQIEVFAWSASGTIISESLSSMYPTIVLFVVDIPKARHPATFVSNMLYATSILYRLRLPVLLVFNKSDISRAELVRKWMDDVEDLQECLAEEKNFSSTLTSSLAVALGEFYRNIRSVEVSARTGHGFEELLTTIFEVARERRLGMESEQREAKDRERAEEEERMRQELTRLREARDDPWAPGTQGPNGDNFEEGIDEFSSAEKDNMDEDEEGELKKLRTRMSKLDADRSARDQG
uniref:GPN-loop GTPase n=1 Tax=Compsopogon caeruleus TaxID=31354 RepID=A0A7S1TDS5_9RHOD|mmetsp:Transcript_18510/g.38786  ORF Transcript_18510/g.38786 Transcript_18510/m.38786 type:complete len:353 (+) Transcript_18510:61-1119(+)